MELLLLALALWQKPWSYLESFKIYHGEKIKQDLPAGVKKAAGTSVDSNWLSHTLNHFSKPALLSPPGSPGLHRSGHNSIPLTMSG